MPQKRKELKIEGANLWYLMGLITSDGCLSSDGRHVNITSKDYNFLVDLKKSLSLVNKIGVKNKTKINEAYYLQIANRNLYEDLLTIGLMPKKSLTLRNLDIPKKFFTDFLRGLIDGDGCIRQWRHSSNYHEQWSLRIFSGSEIFIIWLQSKIAEYLGCRGKVYSELRPNRIHPIYTLKYGKMAARQIVQQCYYPGSFGLQRKNLLAEECINSSISWNRSKTIDSLEFA